MKNQKKKQFKNDMIGNKDEMGYSICFEQFVHWPNCASGQIALQIWPDRPAISDGKQTGLSESIEF